MTKNRSIKQRLERCAPDKRGEIISAWVMEWRNRFLGDLKTMGERLDVGDFVGAHSALGGINEEAAKRFPALLRIFEMLLSDDKDKQEQ